MVADKVPKNIVKGACIGGAEPGPVIDLYEGVPEQVIRVLEPEWAGQTGLVAGFFSGFFATDFRHSAAYAVPEVVVQAYAVFGVFCR